MAPGSFEKSISNHIKQQKKKRGDKIMSGVLFALSLSLSHWALSQFQVFSVSCLSMWRTECYFCKPMAADREQTTLENV